MNDNKGQTVFLSVIGIATLLVAIIGATFAYFSLTVTGNATASSIYIKTAVLGNITFTDGNTISLSNVDLQDALSWEHLTDTANPASPNNVDDKTFTVANTADGSLTNAVNYKIYFVDTGSTLASGSALSTNGTYVKVMLTAPAVSSANGSATSNCSIETGLYTLTSRSVTTGQSGFEKTGTGYLLGTGTFAAGTTSQSHVWTLTIGIVNVSGTTQNDLQGATLQGYIQVVNQ